MKLTLSQHCALVDYSDVPAARSSGWAWPYELGISMRTINELHRAGLLERKGDASGPKVDYRITEAGRNAMKEGR